MLIASLVLANRSAQHIRKQIYGFRLLQRQQNKYTNKHETWQVGYINPERPHSGKM